MEPLTPDEEKIYIEKMRLGDKKAKDILIERNLRLVAHVVKKYYDENRENQDLISIGIVGLIKAVNTYNPDKGNRLVTYAAKCIENTIHMAFLCDQYDFILLTYKKIMDDFLLDFNTYLIIGYVLLEKEGKIVYNNFYKQIINETNDNLTLNDTERAALIKILGSDCKKILGAINKEFTPQLLFECHYFGCNIHENGY